MRHVRSLPVVRRFALVLVSSFVLATTTVLAANQYPANAAPIVHERPLDAAPIVYERPLDAVRYIGNAWWNDNGVVYHTPHVMLVPGRRRPGSDAECCGLLAYGNGPVLVSPRAYLILWGYKTAGDPDKVKKLLERFLANVGGTAWMNTVTQYYQYGQQYIQNPAGMLGGVWDDEKNPIPSSPTQGQIASEAARAVVHFGYDPNGSYVIATAHNHNESGFGTQWCGWHSSTVRDGQVISFTNMPYAPDAPVCGAWWLKQPPPHEQGVDEGVTIIEGHEFAESITDPKPSSGWTNATYGEIGDECAWTDIEIVPMGSYSFVAQPLFSNATDSCVQQYP